MWKRLIMVSLMLVVACQPSAPKPDYSMPRYDIFGKIMINAAQFKIVEQYRSPGKWPFVEDQFPVPIARAVTQWLNDRVQPSGTEGVVVFTISDAHVREEKLETATGLRGVFTKDLVARYGARLMVRAELQSASMGREATAEVSVTASKTLTEGESRTQLFHNMMKEMMEKFNPNMEAQLNQRFRP